MISRPLPEKKISKTNRILESIAILAVVWTFYITVRSIGDLPDSIPIHFDSSGKVDGYGSKSTLWFIPLINLVLTVGLLILNRFPHKFNYIIKITEDNAQFQYKIAQSMIFRLSILISLLFLFLTWHIISTAHGNINGMGFLIYIYFIVSIFGILVFYLYESSKKK